jgi:hypothetical protein
MVARALIAGFSCLRALVAAAIVWTWAGAAAVRAREDAVTPMPRVRSDDLAIAEWIRSGIVRSKTFARLAAEIDHTDGLVYVEEGYCGHSVHACLVLSVTVAGPHRILHIRLDPRGSKRDIICSIGHELQHALEVLRVPSIRTNPDVFSFFRREGPTASERFETSAAVHAGLEVCQELASQK